MAAVPPAQVSAGDQFVPGTMLGKYELLATIGKGGMANVILARQRGAAGFEKVVVIKVIHPHLAQEKSAIDMLRDEARVAAQIEHPNVVHTYELGEAHGTFYIAMEYLAGESLAHVLKSGRKAGAGIHPILAAKIVADAAEGLHAAHELVDHQGAKLEIVHRDVSPGNIVVLYNGTVKVVDFGIAKAHGRVTSTQDGMLKGKYAYMSPEQIRNEPMDRRSDVFSLGVVLWESLAHERLFHTDNVAATLMQILQSKRLPPSHHQPHVPPALDEVALKALDPDPAKRYQSAAEFKKAIDDVIWQSRCGAPEIQAYMSSMFADRIAQRRTLLSRASSASLNRADFEIIASFRDDSVSHAASAAPITGTKTPAIASSNKRRLAIVLGLGVLVGTIAGVLVYANGDQTEQKQVSEAPAAASVVAMEVTPPQLDPVAPAPAVEPAKPDPVEPVAAPAPEPEPTVAEPAPDPVRRQPKPSAPRPAGPGSEELYKKGSDLFLAGNFAAAETSFKQAVTRNRGFAPAHRGLGFVYQRTGEAAKAIAAYKTYLKLAPNASDAAAIKKRIEQLGGGR